MTATKKPNVRELVAWALAAAGIVAATALAMRSEPPADASSPVLFEVALPPGMDLTPVGNQASVAIDLEGTTLVFQGRDSGGREPALFLRRLDDMAVVKIRGTEDGRSPLISPDGSEVLFMPPAPGTGRGGVAAGLRVGLRGGTPRTFIDSASPNGQVSWTVDEPICWRFATRSGRCRPPAVLGPCWSGPDSARKHLRYGFPSLLPGGKAAVFAIWKGSITTGRHRAWRRRHSLRESDRTRCSGTNPRYSSTGHLSVRHR